MTLLRRETTAFAQQKWPSDTIYQYELCELAQRQAVFVRQDKPSDRAIKSDRAKVVMTAGCISEDADITTYIYDTRERQAIRQIRIYVGDFMKGNFSGIIKHK